MDPWVWWLIATGLLLVGEMLTTTLVLAMISGGTAAATVAALAGAGVPLQFGVFAVVALGLLFVVRPIARKHRKQPPAIRTGVDALVGADAEVVEMVTARDGRVKIGGETWSARTVDSDRSIEAGEMVRVIRIDGATALVD
jgi:membrane protein implicated in regulation of membrane protease activity